MEYNYTAIVLGKRKVGETDRIYTFYTLEVGKIQALGKGVRKPRAKLAGHLETLNQSDIIVARRHGLGNIASAVTEHYHTEIKSNPEVLAKVLESVGHFERLVGLEERDVELFLLLQNYLEAMEEIAAKGLSAEARLLNQGFLFQLLSELGYHLEVYRCAVSGVPLVSEGRYCFSAEAGGVVSVEEAARFRNALALSSNAIKLIRIFFHNKLSSLKKVKVDEATLSQVERVSRAFLMWIGH